MGTQDWMAEFAAKYGRRNNADDVKRLRMIQQMISELLADEQAEDAGGEQGDAGKAIAKREDVSPKEGERKYGEDTAFADERNKRYPIDTEEHIRAAWTYVNRPDNADKYDPADVEKIKAKIIAAWKEKIDKAGPPSAQDKKSAPFNLAYAKSLGLAIPDATLIDHLAVKRVTANVIKGHLTLYGDPEKTDVEREFFDANTEHWMDKIALPIPLTYDHAQEEATKSDPVIGQITDWGKDEVGVWYAAQLDRNYRYRKAIDQLIEEGALGTSSDSAPQYIQRKKAKSGATYLARWPIFAAALTTTPAEPRQLDTVDYFKSIGVVLPVENSDALADQARVIDAAAARRQLDLLRLSI